jgi:demethylmenaquinone methyltransferase/2-methoxy-6-polyprenyl-1,4-benzoquinol methylase
MRPVTAVSVEKSPDRISGMFDAIAPRYDLLNRVLSAGIDRYWRRRAIASLGTRPDGVLLDVCCGTADVALQARAAGAVGKVVGVDFAGAMLAIGHAKVARAGESARIALLRGDATALPAASGSADGVTVAFGIRNVERPELACREMTRVLRPGGRLAILEFGEPRLPGLAALYRWYFRHVLPRVGRLISGQGVAYSYLPASVSNFPPPEVFCQTLRAAGFVDVRAVPLTLGIVYLYMATAPPASTAAAVPRPA